MRRLVAALVVTIAQGCSLPPAHIAQVCRCPEHHVCSWPLPERRPVCEFIGDGHMGDPGSDGDGALVMSAPP